MQRLCLILAVVFLGCLAIPANLTAARCGVDVKWFPNSVIAMREIPPNQLWIGNAGDGRDPERLLAAGIATSSTLLRKSRHPTCPAA